jgi:hypothetical protein
MQGIVKSVDTHNKTLVAEGVADGKQYQIDLLAPLAPPDRKQKVQPRRVLQRSPIVTSSPTSVK